MSYVAVMTDDDGDVYEKYADELIRFATMLVGPSGAEDVLADAVIRAFTSPRWPLVTNQRAYLYRAVFSEASNVSRAAQRRMNRELRVATDDVAPESLALELLDALRRLTVRQRAVVHLAYWVDLPLAEIARTLKVGERTVERELSAARRRLEALLR